MRERGQNGNRASGIGRELLVREFSTAEVRDLQPALTNSASTILSRLGQRNFEERHHIERAHQLRLALGNVRRERDRQRQMTFISWKRPIGQSSNSGTEGLGPGQVDCLIASATLRATL